MVFQRGHHFSVELNCHKDEKWASRALEIQYVTPFAESTHDVGQGKYFV